MNLPCSGLKAFSLALALACASAVLSAQQPASQADFPEDYPPMKAGVLVHAADWVAVESQLPSKTKAAHSIAASLSYGVVPVKIVATYAGEHASTSLNDAQPVFCICHILSLPGEPVIVRLHGKKGERELDGGRMVVYPVVGNAKMADANKSDLLAVDILHPDPQVWLVRPKTPLSPGDYALMLGTQNVAIFPFTVAP